MRNTMGQVPKNGWRGGEAKRMYLAIAIAWIGTGLAALFFTLQAGWGWTPKQFGAAMAVVAATAWFNALLFRWAVKKTVRLFFLHSAAIVIFCVAIAIGWGISRVGWAVQVWSLLAWIMLGIIFALRWGDDDESSREMAKFDAWAEAWCDTNQVALSEDAYEITFKGGGVAVLSPWAATVFRNGNGTAREMVLWEYSFQYGEIVSTPILAGGEFSA